MAVLTNNDLAPMRREAVRLADFDATKAEINAAIQAIEDWFDKPAVQSSLSSDIDAATSPTVLTNVQKKKLAKFWMRYRWVKE